VTQPQFSRRIRALELWAGADLVNRAVVPLRLTSAGEELLPAARRAVAGLSEVRARVAPTQGGAEWIVVATARTLTRTALPGWITRVKRITGDFRLRIVTVSLYEGAAALEHGGVDFLLSFAHPGLAMTLDENVFEGMTIGTDELVAVSAASCDGRPQHALPGTSKNPTPFLSYAPSMALDQIRREGLAHQQQEMHLRTVVESDSAVALLDQAIAGIGVAWLPRALAAEALRDKRLVAADGGHFGATGIPYGIRLYRSRKPRSELIRRTWEASASA
jgi:DNA-binding transcriptional LysR family regulator